jgi:hypothetical protein
MLSSRRTLLAFTVLALAACSGSSGGSSPTVSLAVTDAASDELSTFTIGVESVSLVSAANGTIELLQEPVAVDFVALSELSRLLNVTAVPADVYTGVEVVLVYDGDRVHVNGDNQPAMLTDGEGMELTGTQMLPIDFALPLEATGGNNYVLELDLDLDQSVDVDAGGGRVLFEPSLIPRVNRPDPREHAVGGFLRTVVLERDLFRIGLESGPGDPVPVVEIEVGPGTVFQIDGVCLLGAAGLSQLDTLLPGSWVQAFGSLGASSARFQAATVEAGSGSYNGGTDIVEGLITGRTGGAGADATLTVRGHSNNSTHTVLEFNLNYTVNTSFASTKVVRRGSATQFDPDELQIGQRVRMFGVLDTLTNTLDLSMPTDVARLEPTHVFGIASGAPTAGKLVIDLARVDLRDASLFAWNEGGATPADPANFVLQVGNLGAGKGITAGTPVHASGFFTALGVADSDFVASTLVNAENVPASLLLVRDRASGLTVTPTTLDTEIDFAFAGAAAGFEKAVVDQGFLGETDVVATGITVLPGNPFSVGLYTLRDRTLNTLSIYLTFAAFSQGLEDALLGGATLLNFSALGTFDSGAAELESALASAVVQ